MKTCATCNVAKDESEFYTRLDKPNERSCSCKDCINERAERDADERRRKTTVRWQQANIERCREAHARYVRKAKDMTQSNATRAYTRWAQWEDDVIMNSDHMTAIELGVQLNRTYSSIAKRRAQLRNKQSVARVVP